MWKLTGGIVRIILHIKYESNMLFHPVNVQPDFDSGNFILKWKFL